MYRSGGTGIQREQIMFVERGPVLTVNELCGDGEDGYSVGRNYVGTERAYTQSERIIQIE